MSSAENQEIKDLTISHCPELVEEKVQEKPKKKKTPVVVIEEEVPEEEEEWEDPEEEYDDEEEDEEDEDEEDEEEEDDDDELIEEYEKVAKTSFLIGRLSGIQEVASYISIGTGLLAISLQIGFVVASKFI